MIRQKGYDFVLKINNLLIAGSTQHRLDITPQFEELCLNSKNGARGKQLADVDYAFAISGLMYLKETGETSALTDFEAIRELAPAGSDHEFIYGNFQSGNRILSGTCKITSYSESTDATTTGNYSLSLETVHCSWSDLKTPLYGLLYNWYAVSDIRGIAPVGCHIPSIEEFDTLRDNVSNLKTAGGYLKEVGYVHWEEPNDSATDLVGFCALGAGNRLVDEFTNFGGIKQQTVFLSADFLTEEYCRCYGINYYSAVFLEQDTPKTTGSSIRCIMNNPNEWYLGMTILDYDGNLYHTTKIGTQIWLCENLAVTHYGNGDIIPEVTDNEAWAALTSGALCAYNNDRSEIFK